MWRMFATSMFSAGAPEYSSSKTPFHGLLLLVRMGAVDITGRLFPVFNSTNKCLCSDIERIPGIDDRARRGRLPPTVKNCSAIGPSGPITPKRRGGSLAPQMKEY